MPRMQILSAPEQEAFDLPPLVDFRERKRWFERCELLNSSARSCLATAIGPHAYNLELSQREKRMGRFKSPRQAQRFLAAHDQINVIFRPRRYRLTAKSYRHARADAFRLWQDYTREMTA